MVTMQVLGQKRCGGGAWLYASCGKEHHEDSVGSEGKGREVGVQAQQVRTHVGVACARRDAD